MNFKTMKAAMKGGQGFMQKSTSIKQNKESIKEETPATKKDEATKPASKAAAVLKPKQDNKALAEI